MLRSLPWRRLGLTVRWANQEYKREFPPELAPPIHMPIAYGPIETPKNFNSPFVPPPLMADHLCQLCLKPFDESSDVTYLSLHCPLRCPLGVWHVVCLARHLTSDAAKRPLSTIRAEEPSKPQLLPLDGICPACERAEFLWPELLASQQPGTFK
uniref:Structure-specific endonuclease subunit slx1 n=1 Tax=Schistocephalus solidus TaxID=70667 RepID=A0A0X3PTR0_SCHSO